METPHVAYGTANQNRLINRPISLFRGGHLVIGKQERLRRTLSG